MTLRIEESRDNGRSLYGIFVRIAGKGGQALAVTAAQGTFLATDDPDTIIFRLKNGVLVHDSPKYEAPRILTRSEEHTSELQSLMRISYAVFCLKKKKKESIKPTE